MAIGLTVLAAGCSPRDDPSPFAESRTPAQLGERFQTPEGWAWGYLQVGGAPAQRYGVAAGRGVPAAQIRILPAYGESAEDWFETIRDLNRRRFTVWLLEGVGQGGSGRLTGTRDLGHVASLDNDVAAVEAMTRTVIRPTRRAPLIVLGEGIGGATAVRALAGGADAAGLIISAPRPDQAGRRREPGLDILRRIGLGGWRAPGYRQPRGGDAWRQAASAQWRRTNPDLRMAGPSLDRLAAERHTMAIARRAMTTITAPVLVVGSYGAAPELAADAVRAPWLAAIVAFARARSDDARAP